MRKIEAFLAQNFRDFIHEKLGTDLIESDQNTMNVSYRQSTRFKGRKKE